MNKQIKTVQISRSYDRKIKFGDQYEMLGLFSSYNAMLENPTEKDIEETSEWLYKKAEADVELQVDIRQNPGKVVRGFASINELKTIINQQNKKMEELEKEIQELKLKQNQGLPF
jgi:peptidoglycan hydrolase CwlO-like protein